MVEPEIFSFNLFWLLMIGYQIPISLSCSLPSSALCCSLEDCFGEHLEAGCWIGSILAGPCAPATALRAWTLGHGPQRRAEPVVGVGRREKGKEACQNIAAHVSCTFCLCIICFHAVHSHKILFLLHRFLLFSFHCKRAWWSWFTLDWHRRSLMTKLIIL